MARCTGVYLQQWRAGSNGAVTSIGSTRRLTATLAAQPNGTISAAGACLMMTADTLGAPLRLARCTGGQAQRWQLLSGTVASELLNPTSGLCLTVPGHHPQGSRLVLGYCDPAAPATTWRLS